jgi:hypothetical protein
MWSIKRFLYFTALIAIGLTFTSCPKPFNMTMTDMDEKSPQQKAVIELSDPQVYARETLVNDRYAEIKYLKGLLEESKTLTFEPTLRRDVRSVAAVAAQLGLSFDPTKGIQFDRAKALSDIQQEIKLTRLQAELEQERAKLHALQEQIRAAEVAKPGQVPASGPSPTGENETVKAAKLPDTQTPGLGGAEKIAGKVENLIGKAQAELEKDTKAVRETAVTASPQELFRDRQAYREELRAALAAVNLDDLHDYNGNSLYRLQFRATVAPGEHKNKWGVARLTVLPPKLEENELRELYLTWLSHTTYRLNQVSRGKLFTDPGYQALGDSSALFSTIVYPFFEKKGDSCSKYLKGMENKFQSTDVKDLVQERISTWLSGARKVNCPFIKLAVRPDYASDLQPMFSYHIYGRKLRRQMTEFLSAAKEKAVTNPDFFKLNLERGPCKFFKNPEANSKPLVNGGLCPKEALTIARRAVRASPSLGAALQGLGDKRFVAEPFRKPLEAIFEIVPDLIQISREYIEFLGQQMEHGDPCRETVSFESYLERGRNVPEKFKNILVHKNAKTTHEEKGCQPCLAEGQAYAHATSPVEFSQSLSTVAGAANAIQLALAMSAAQPSSGVGADAALGYMRSAVGRIEALERTPLVVGFSHRSKTEEPQFGWVFGPKIRVDTAKNQLILEHSVVNYALSADISLPGWWPRIDLKLNTAWVGNWHNLGSLDILRSEPEEGKGAPAHEQSFHVPLPLNRADLDSLTNLLAKKTIGLGLQRTHISHVEPEKISQPTDEVTFLIYGTNVWRSTEAFLGGLRAEDIQVLPDMEGIAAKFKVSQPPVQPLDAPKVDLTVWTRNGFDTYCIEITQSDKNSKKTSEPCEERR